MPKAKTKKTTNKSVKKTKQTAKDKRNRLIVWAVFVLFIIVFGLVLLSVHRGQKSDLDNFKAQPFNRVRPLVTPRSAPTGKSPAFIKSVYSLPSSGGSGTIAIIDAYDSAGIESYLSTFDSQYGLRACTTSNGCFEKHKMASHVRSDSGWSIEIALDVEWAHAIAPNAKILLVEARSNSGTDLMDAIDYARGRSDVKAISMSWGGNEFSTEANYENHFVSNFGATFFASSGDSGTGTSWPAVSANVVSVGGTTINLLSGNFSSETAWNGSGGGISSYINEPAYQTTYGVGATGGKRATPDVSYNANPSSGFPVYSSRWYQVGGTSAGAPQWAALRSIVSFSGSKLYQDAAAHYSSNFRDITSGTNGSCGLNCTATTGYDLVTGLGSPLGVNF